MIVITRYRSKEDRIRVNPNDRGMTDDDFAKYQTKVDEQIAELKRQNMPIQEIILIPEEFEDWVKNVASTDVKRMTPAEQRATYGTWKAFQGFKN